MLCEHCEDEQATEIEDFGGTENEVRLCDDCQDSLPYDEYTHERVPEIVDNINGYDVGQYTVDHHTITCDWSGDLCLMDYVIELTNGDLIHSNYEDEIVRCYECGYRHHYENMHNDGNYDYCEDCLPEEGDRWSTRFTKRECHRFRKYPVRNHVGMEFEAENGSSLEGYTDLRHKFIAEAKEDGSLQNGTEYVSHPLRGEDILDCIQSTCTALAKEEWTLSDRVGFHFHYDITSLTNQRLKNVWNAFEKFSSMMSNQTTTDYRYFQNMLRHYSENWTNSYKRWASSWAKTGTKDKYNEFVSDYGDSQGRYVWANFEPLRAGRDTIEIRMYQPNIYRRYCTNSGTWDEEMYQLLADDYANFIRFFHEFIRKSAYNPAGMRFFDENDEVLSIKKFASQFTDPVRKWLEQRNKDYVSKLRE